MPISFSQPTSREARARGAGVTAVLGPTNTGKTHLAIERMLAHSTGIIGLPLRLLAREVYNKVAERVGAEQVALITGEEKIKPPNPRFWVATVEAMPRDLDVAFLAVDEIQLGADFERGHVFTDRMLHRRGREETLVLGAATMRGMVEKLLPGAHIISRPRLSQLSFAGEKKLTRLPRRSAVVTFSAEEVYAIGELIRRQRGGAAVVLGALSPRTRNAQVALYQAGDVDYLVATDAIGMGLNLDVDHVAFAADRKFDGYQYRKLNPAELAQIAGRAGRAMRDGTFGTTGRCPPFEQELVQALESHVFEPVKLLQWRNTALDFSSIGALQATLAAAPTENGLTRAPVAEDILVLEHAARDAQVRSLATTPAHIERLWDVCQVPDYRKIAPATHAELAVTLYSFLRQEGTIPSDWFARQVAQADRTDGGIDTLSNRIAHVRTWTYVANRPDWLDDPEHWQGVTRAVEDKLSDALHERLTERFVDRRTSVLMRRLRENTMLETEIGKSGEVTVEGHMIGRLDGFTFLADASTGGSEAKALGAAAQKVLAGEIDARAAKLAEAADNQLVLDSTGTIRWTGAAVGKLIAGDDLLRPRIRIIADEYLSGAPRDNVQARLDLWLKTQIERVLAPLFALSAAEDVTGIARGVAYQLVEALGVLDRNKVAEEIKSLDQPARATLRKYGVRFGAYHIYVPTLLKPAPRLLASELWVLKHGEVNGLTELQQLAASGRTSIPVDKTIDKDLYRMVGYRVCGERALRVDILERLADLIRAALTWRAGAPGAKPDGAINGFGFNVSGAMTSLTGASGEDFASILRSLGYRMEKRPKPPEDTPPAGETTATEQTSASAEAEPALATEATSGEAASVAGSSEPAPGDDAPADAAITGPPIEPTSESAPSVVPDAEQAASEVGGPVLEPSADEQQEAAEGPAEPASPSEPASEIAAGSGEAAGEAASEAAPETPSASSSETSAEAPAPSPAAEPELIEIWRPGRPAEERRGPRRPRRPRGERAAHAGKTAETAAGSTDAGAVEAAAAVAPGDAPPADAEQGERRRRRHRKRHARTDQPEEGRQGPRPPRKDRPERGEQGERPRKFRRSERHGRDRDDNRPPRVWNSEKPGRSNEPDPNSPFAKLAALKAQLEGDKEQR